MIDGVEVKLLGKTWIVPPLNLKAVKTIGPKIEALENMRTQNEIVQLAGEVFFYAIKRNYPEITQDDVDEMVDLSNAQELMFAVLGQSGFRKKEEGETGEAKAVEGTTIGTSSIAS